MPPDHFLPPDLPDAAAAYVESMPPGRVELFSLAPLDRTGVACWNAIFLNQDGTRFHGVTPHGVGYGTTDAEAIVGTTGELAEAVHSAGAIARFPRRIGSYAALAAELGPRGIADPLTLCLPAGSPVTHDSAMEWVPAQRWPGGGTVLVPTEIAACSVGDFSPGYQPFTTPITNGLGAGPTLDFAIGHGVCELLQRDGNGTGFRAMDRGIVLDLEDGPADPRTRALLTRLAELDIDVLPKFATDEFGVANVYCVGGERDASAPFPNHGHRRGRGRLRRPRAGVAQGAVRVRRRPGAQALQPRPARADRRHRTSGLCRALPPLPLAGRRGKPRPARDDRVVRGGRAHPARLPGGDGAVPPRHQAFSRTCRPGTARCQARPWSPSSRGGSPRRAWRSCSSTSRRPVRPTCTS